jgi:lipoyl(octanoyl) transferase
MRLILDDVSDGPTNMARDEAMMIEVGSKNAPPTLRLYQWSQPTISLGYFQKYADYEALSAPAGTLPVVRRLTGGGAILHDLELTYSIALPIGHALLKDGPNRLYELAHDAIIASLKEMDLIAARCGMSDDSGAARGPFFCFARRHCYDVLLGPDKIAGSAQRRTRHVILQHGSIILANRFPQQRTAFQETNLESGVDERILLFTRLLPAQFKKLTTEAIEPMPWTPSERSSASILIHKYGGEAWTRRS